MQDYFKVPETTAQGIYKEKGSSFISYIYPLLEEERAKFFLSELKKEHPKARHICYAYRWGADPEYTRSSDDGEPAGTAGKPILNQIRSHNLENTLIAVVRYFGGTLLGSSGLTSAYKSSAKDVISNAQIIEKRRNCYFEFDYPYTMEKQVASWMKSMGGIEQKKEFGIAVMSNIAFPISLEHTVTDSLNQTAIQFQWIEPVLLKFSSKDLF